jgi:hypothetical protein
LVAGVAALVASAQPGLDAMQIRQAILDSVIELPSLQGLVQTSGRLDAFGALERAAAIAGNAVPGTRGSSAPASTPGTSGRDATGRPISFAPHADYQVPGAGATLGIPSGRGQPDPAGVPAAPTGASDSAAPAADRTKGGGGNALPASAAGAAVVVVTVLGVRRYYRRRSDGSLVPIDEPESAGGFKPVYDQTRAGYLQEYEEQASFVEEGPSMDTTRTQTVKTEVFYGRSGADGVVREGLSTHAGLAEERAHGFHDEMAVDTHTGVRKTWKVGPGSAQAGVFAGSEVTSSYTFGNQSANVTAHVSGSVGAGLENKTSLEIGQDGIRYSNRTSATLGVGGGGGIDVHIKFNP